MWKDNVHFTGKTGGDCFSNLRNIKTFEMK